MFKNIKKDYLNIFIPLWKNEYYAGPYIFFVEIFGQSNNKPDISHNIQMRAIFCIEENTRHVLIIFPPIECSIVDDC